MKGALTLAARAIWVALCTICSCLFNMVVGCFAIVLMSDVVHKNSAMSVQVWFAVSSALMSAKENQRKVLRKTICDH